MKTILITLILVLIPCIAFAVECANSGPYDIAQTGGDCGTLGWEWQATIVSIAPPPDPGDVLFVQIMMQPLGLMIDLHFAISCPDGTLTPLFDMDQPIVTSLGCFDLYLDSYEGGFVSPEQVDLGFNTRLENVGSDPECGPPMPSSVQCVGSFTALNETVSGGVATWGGLKSAYR